MDNDGPYDSGRTRAAKSRTHSSYLPNGFDMDKGKSMNRELMKLRLTVCSWVFLLGSCNPATAVPAAPRTTLTIARSMSPINLLLQVAEVQKLWVQEGIDMHEQVFASARQAMDSIISNSADLATVSDTPLLIALHRNVHLKLLCTFSSSDRHFAIVIKSSVPKATCSGLAGKRIAYSIGTTQQFFFYHFLRTDPDDCGVVSINLSPPDALTAFAAGNDVDGIVAWEPQLSLASRVPGASVEYGNGLHQVFGLGYGRKSMALNPALRSRIRRVLDEASKWVSEHPEKTRDLLAASQQIPSIVADNLLKSYTFTVNDGDELIEEMAEQEEWARSKSYIKEMFGKSELEKRVKP
jgi:ABC-type nitrate/sulfonate/bicarbonate transport system substrate-binding protein